MEGTGEDEEQEEEQMTEEELEEAEQERDALDAERQAEWVSGE